MAVLYGTSAFAVVDPYEALQITPAEGVVTSLQHFTITFADLPVVVNEDAVPTLQKGGGATLEGHMAADGDGKTVLLAEDDAATVNLGNGWRTPKSKEFKELRENCTWTWTTQGGVSGMRVTGPNGKSIFLPAGGWYENSTLNSKGSYGSYWTASGDGGTASAVDFINNDKSAALVPRSEGRSVRPVKD